jgi:hypothetical protein
MKNKITVENQEISITKDDYISLTDMVRNIDNGLVLKLGLDIKRTIAKLNTVAIEQLKLLLNYTNQLEIK